MLISSHNPFPSRLRELHRELNIPRDYGLRNGRVIFSEATHLQVATPSHLGKAQRLTPQASAAWSKMSAAASADGIYLSIVSAFRSYEDQAEIIRARLQRGKSIQEILCTVAAPGYSEHHLGTVVDIGTSNYDYHLDNFEQTAAFAWLQENASNFNFTMTYPRDNPYGFIYEPWHWALRSEFEGL